ncbi:carotenoid biosynthesis protein [Candidatus Thorarchaeota archaeon]|nr:MAG: carotenoid biosynthesis protein [Candidatus Thorarchaeota archaeon]
MNQGNADSDSEIPERNQEKVKEKRFDTFQLFFTILPAVFFFISWLVANVPIAENVIWVSALFIVILAIPSYVFLYRWVGLRLALLILVVFSILPIAIEAVGITTGFPYGWFYYSENLGYKVLGLVPWSVAFAFAPLVLGSLSLASYVTDDARLAIPLSAMILVWTDLLLDPAAVLLEIWIWAYPGPYYGIPISNYVGWFLTATLASTILHGTISGKSVQISQLDSRLASSHLLIAAFWTGYTVWTGLVIPAVLGMLLFIILYYFVVIRR